MIEKITFDFTPLEGGIIGELLSPWDCDDTNNSIAISKCIMEFRKQMSNQSSNHHFRFKFTPFQALTISTLLSYWNCDDPRFDKAIHESVLSYRKQLKNKLTHKQYEDAWAEYQVDILLGKCK